MKKFREFVLGQIPLCQEVLQVGVLSGSLASMVLILYHIPSSKTLWTMFCLVILHLQSDAFSLECIFVFANLHNKSKVNLPKRKGFYSSPFLFRVCLSANIFQDKKSIKKTAFIRKHCQQVSEIQHSSTEQEGLTLSKINIFLILVYSLWNSLLYYRRPTAQKLVLIN